MPHTTRHKRPANRDRKPARCLPAGDFYAPATPHEAPAPAAPLDPTDPAAEIARLQLQLRRILSRRPGDTRLVLRTSEIWLRAALAAHRVSPTSTNDTAQRAAAVFAQIQKQLLPGESDMSS